MKAKIALFPPLLAALAGCHSGASSGPSLDMMAQAAAPAAATRAAPPRAASVDSALAHLPEGAGGIRAVRERYYPNGYGQDIVLDSDAPRGASHVAVSIQNGRAPASSEKAPVWKPGEAGVKGEIAREFPGMVMRVVANGGYENRYGRFGVAVGSDGGALRCIYAWQYVDDARRSFDHGARIPLDGVEAAPAAVRIKLCRTDATADALVAYAKAIVIDIPEGYASSPPVALRIAPAQAPRLRAARAPSRKDIAHRPAHRAEATQEAQFQTPAYPSAYPTYPAAPVSPYAQAPMAALPVMPAAQPVAGAPRYLAPVAAAAPASSSASLDASLPPQAYRGPATRVAPDSGPANSNPYRREGARAYDGAGGLVEPARAHVNGAPRVLPLPNGGN